MVRWRERRRTAILETLRAHLGKTRLAQAHFDLPCPVVKIAPHQIDIVGDGRTADETVLRVNALHEGAPTSLDAQSARVSIDYRAEPLTVDLIRRDSLPVFNTDLRITLGRLSNFGFACRQEDKGLFGALQPATQRAPRLNPIPSIPPQREQETGQSMEDRLRWILTPPIHELLSDSSLGLPATPYKYEVFGIAWLRAHSSALLADEMGLGKTMQAIIAARLLWREGQVAHILIVCPKTLIGTWRHEIGKWWANATPNVCEPTGDTRRFLKLATRNVTIKIINYEKLPREADWLAKGERCGSHDLIIIDEAQRIKNPATKTAKAVTALQGKRRWALTGTPLETKTGDVLSIFEFLRPGLLEGDEPDYVRERIRPFFLRRRVEDVDLDLPDKDDHDVEVELSPRQRQAYDRAEEVGVVGLNEKGDTITVQHVFALIQSLMQLCNFDPVSGESVKLERLNDDLEEIIESGRKVLVFSRFVSEQFGLKRVKKGLAPLCKVVEVHGKIPQRERDAGISAFATDASVNTMLLQYRAGGVGLNLQAANYVYLFDRWWNPAVEDQAVKRAHRIGQKNKVFIRRFYCRETIEDRILEKLAERRRLFAHVIDDNRPNEAMGLSEEELFSLFKNLKARPKRIRTAAHTPRIVLRNLDPSEFENLVAKLYEAQGFTVRVVGGSHDGGVDIEGERSSATGSDRIVIQCKHTKAKVGRPEVQKLFGVVSADQRLTRGDLVTSSDFTAEARIFAGDKRIELINRKGLVKLAKEARIAEFEDA